MEEEEDEVGNVDELIPKKKKKTCCNNIVVRRKKYILISSIIIMMMTGIVILIIFLLNAKQEIIQIPTACVNNETNIINNVNNNENNKCNFYMHTKWNNVLQNFLKTDIVKEGVTFNAFDYSGILQDRSLLDEYLEFLKSAKLKGLTRNGQLALLLNAYNAFAIDMVISNLCNQQLCTSIRDVPNVPLGVSVWKWKRFILDETKFSLDDIEHGMIRPTFKDPRIHSAVNCASISCPDLRKDAYEELNVQDLLTNQTKLWLQKPNNKGLKINSNNVISLSKIFDWYLGDFENEFPNGMSNFIKTFGGSDGKSYANQYGNDINDWNIEYFDYNWNLNIV